MSNSSPKQIVQGMLAWVILFLYFFICGAMIVSVSRCGVSGACSSVTFGSGVLTVVTTIGALVSALVIATLARTDAGGELAIAGASTASRSGRWLPWIYIGAWFVVGVSALVAGVLLFPEVNQSVSDVGTSWLGTAIAAAYAYFGIKAPGVVSSRRAEPRRT